MSIPVSGLILASSSPRRKELLKQIGIKPDHILAANVDEAPIPKELPLQYVKRIAAAKAEAVASCCDKGWILAADTVVAMGRRILPKAEDASMVKECLELLSGRRHRVLTSVVVMKCEAGKVVTKRQKTVETLLQWKHMSLQEIEAYVAAGEGIGKAGGYAIQGKAAQFVPWINGSYSNVVGLPLYETSGLLQGLGYNTTNASSN